MQFLYSITPVKLLAFLTLCCLILSPHARSETIVLASGEWPPFTSESLKHNGFYSHIVTEAFALEGITVAYEFYPWARSYHLVESGEVDASPTWAETPQKIKEVLFSDPIVSHTKVFFHLKSLDFKWKNYEDLKRWRIAATQKYTYGEEFDEKAKNETLSVDYGASDLINLKKVMSNRVDIFPSDIFAGYDLIHSNFTEEEAEQFSHHDRPIQETNTAVVFSKKHPKKSKRLITALNRGLKKLKENGTYDAIIESFKRGEYKKERIE